MGLANVTWRRYTFLSYSMTKSTKKEVPRALLVQIKTPEMTDDEAAKSFEELERLVTTLGFRVLTKETQKLPSTNGASAVGAGKLRQLAQQTASRDEPDLANVVVFDCDLRPSQLRHLETGLGVEVLDRTGVIIEIFSRHAKTRLAKMQVEIARLNYLSPRLREVGSSGERQQGRGSGESALETERRAIRDRLAELKRDLAKLQGEQSGRRAVRAEQRTVALVGYTNAGKSSLMRALTGSEVLVENKLFATLDTTVRALQPEVNPRILVSDTVGFIQKLPHDLVASFRSTLDEARQAALLLYVVDAADANFRAQLAVVEEVLAEMGIKNPDSLLVLNKVDLLDDLSRRRLQREFPQAVQVSTRRKLDVKALRERIIGFFDEGMAEATLFAPYSQKGVVGEIRAQTRVLAEKHGEEGTWFTVRAESAALERLKAKFRLS